MNPKQAQRIAKQFTLFGSVKLDGHTVTLHTKTDGTDAEVLVILELPCMGIERGASAPIYMTGSAFCKALRAAGPSGLIAGHNGTDPTVSGVAAIGDKPYSDYDALFTRVAALMPDTEPVAEFSVPLDRLAAVSAMRASDDIRRYLCGLMVDHRNGRLAGCDGHVLGVANSDTIPKAADGAQYIVPGEAVDAILAAGASDWSLIPGQPVGYLLAAGEGSAILVKCSPMKYPDIDRVTPSLKDRRLASVNDPQALAKRLLDADRRGKVIDPGKPVMVVLTYRNVDANDCVLDVSVPILGPASEITQLPADWTNGKTDTGFKIGIDARLLARALMNAPLGMTLYFSTEKDAVRAQSAWLDCTVMPMRM